MCKFMTFEQMKDHKCEAKIVEIKEIPVLYCYELEGDNNRKTVIAHGFDGVLYRLVECDNSIVMLSDKVLKPKKKSFDDFLQRKKSDKDFTESLNARFGKTRLIGMSKIPRET